MVDEHIRLEHDTLQRNSQELWAGSPDWRSDFRLRFARPRPIEAGLPVGIPAGLVKLVRATQRVLQCCACYLPMSYLKS